MTKDEALKLALEALESIEWHGAGSCWVLDDEKVESAEAALREAVAQPEQPVQPERQSVAETLAQATDRLKEFNAALQSGKPMRTRC